jgi:phosphate transport system protein
MDMPRNTFERELGQLQDNLLVLGSLVEDALVESVSGLKAQDLERARKLITGDRLINQKRFAIETDVLELIATQQPMASDLRVLASVLEIATELERIGDYAKGVAKITLLIGEEPLIKPLIDLPRMSEMVRDMLHKALEAFVRRDTEMARAVAASDTEIDALYNQVYRELLTFIISDPHTIKQATDLLWVGHNLERAADRVTNICERTIFTVTGQLLELEGEEDMGVEGLA